MINKPKGRPTGMSARTFCCGVLALLIGSAAALADAPPATQPSIDPLADQILHQSCDFLAQTPAFSVHAEVWKDIVLPSGHKIQVTRSIDLDLRRPDRLHVDARAHRKGARSGMTAKRSPSWIARRTFMARSMLLRPSTPRSTLPRKITA